MPGPRCPVMDDIVRRLNVGDLRLWFYFPGGGEPSRFSPDLSGGQPVYRVPLPEGTIRPGRFGVEAAGSNEVEPFLTQVEIPAPIRVTTDLRAGMRFVTPSMFFPPPIRITWEGGDPQSAVMVTLREPSRSPVGWNTYNFRSWTALASRGEITITPRYGTFDIDVWNYREGEHGATFFTRGLDTPGRHGWRYQFIYGDLGYVLQPFRTSGN